MWTQFWDMHSGGRSKLDWEYIYIELPQAEAEVYFENRFGRDPNNVTCECCGGDYSISECESLYVATAYQRRLRFAQKKNKNPPQWKYLEPHENLPVGWEFSSYTDEGNKGIKLCEYVDSKHVLIVPIASRLEIILAEEMFSCDWSTGALLGIDNGNG